MLSNRKWLSLIGGCGIALLLGAPAVSLTTGKPFALPTPHGLSSLATPRAVPTVEADARNAAVTFINAMAHKDAPRIWMFASEEDQDAFGTENNVYSAFAETFPILADAKSVEVIRSWQEGDTPFVQARITAKDGAPHEVTMGFWLSDAGDWQLVSCGVDAGAEDVASF